MLWQLFLKPMSAAAVKSSQGGPHEDSMQGSAPVYPYGATGETLLPDMKGPSFLSRLKGVVSPFASFFFFLVLANHQPPVHRAVAVAKL